MKEYKTMRLIHYGAKRYDPERFKPIANRNFVKPDGGLWASPVDSEYGWKDWCEDENFSDCSEGFEFEYTGVFLVIDGVHDLGAIPWRSCPYISTKLWPDYEALVNNGIDAIHLTVRGQYDTRWSTPDLYGWDCECVLILNPTGIEPDDNYRCCYCGKHECSH